MVRTEKDKFKSQEPFFKNLKGRAATRKIDSVCVAPRNIKKSGYKLRMYRFLVSCMRTYHIVPASRQHWLMFRSIELPIPVGIQTLEKQLGAC